MKLRIEVDVSRTRRTFQGRQVIDGQELARAVQMVAARSSGRLLNTRAEGRGTADGGSVFNDKGDTIGTWELMSDG